MSSAPETPAIAFRDLGLPDSILQVLARIGYETPSPIQAQTIPLLLQGRDVLGQAQTGTGKTAAFALPALARLKLDQSHTQVLVLAPTRELAIQVAEAFQTYASHLDNFHVLPIYGGADYRTQFRQLKQGAQVVVGTPGRVMDHMRRGTLNLSQLSCLVLDEADEMLRMGFIDDVEWILEQTPATRQIALFSATMPKEVRRIAQQHLKNPAEITIAVKTTTAPTIRQRYWPVSGVHKLDALTRILEAENFDGMLVFVRTKTETVELADKLRARGYHTAALNGDIAQAQREKTVAQLKRGDIDILVATDVAARGLDVERISHVVNYDIPIDTEAYVHRIGRTGRAGRAGDAILFVSPREKRMLFAIEKATRQQIERMELPTTKVINDKRIAKFKQQITDTLDKFAAAPEKLDTFRDLIAQYQHETGAEIEKIAPALAVLAQQGKDLLLKEKDKSPAREMNFDDERDNYRERKPRKDYHERGERHEQRRDRREHRERDDSFHDRKPRRDREPRAQEAGMDRYRIDVGNEHGAKPGSIVGAIANEADIDSKFIGQIKIHDDYSTVDLPDNLSKETLEILKKARVSGRPMNIVRINPGDVIAGGDDYDSERPFRGKRESSIDKSYKKDRPFEKRSFEKKSFEKKPFEKKSFKGSYEKRPYEKKSFDGDKPFKKRFSDEGGSFEKRDFDKKPFKKKFSGKPGDKGSYGKKPFGGDKPFKKKFRKDD